MTELQESARMAKEGVVTLYTPPGPVSRSRKNSSFSLESGPAKALRHGAIVEVTNEEQAKIAADAGACAVIVVAASGDGNAGRMIDPSIVKRIKRIVSVPVLAKVRVGHFVEAQILQVIGVNYVDESEALLVADAENHINKQTFEVPFMCGCKELGQALRRLREGAVLIRTEGDLTGTGDIAETVKNVRSVMGDIKRLSNMDEDESYSFARQISAPYDLVAYVRQLRRLPALHFAAGGIVTPADAAMMMQLGCDGVIIGPHVFSDPDPYRRVRAIVLAVMHYNDIEALTEISCGALHAGSGLTIHEV